MVIIDNLWIKIPPDHDRLYDIRSLLTRSTTRTRRDWRTKQLETIPEVIRAYKCDNDLNVYVPLGLYEYVKDFLGNDIQDIRTHTKLSDTDDLISRVSDFKNILDGVTLRDFQVMALRKILYCKRCLIQASTGAGKSEIMCVTAKALAILNDNITPTILVIEPTGRLVKDMCSRFQKYDIPVNIYNNGRQILKNTVNICHPKSLNNDLVKDPNTLKDIQVMFGDECHHLSSNSQQTVVYSMPNLEYSIGLSASVIDQAHVGLTDFTQYTYNELLAIGATGPLVMNVKTKDMVNQGNLALPILAVMHNNADEDMHGKEPNDWHAICEYRLESYARSKLIVDTASVFHKYNRKTLILVNTIRWAHKLMEIFDEVGLRDYVRASFGGGNFQSYNGYEFIQEPQDIYERYAAGEFTILIGTSHIYEGADIPNLDTVILAYGGKKDRLQIQGIGRGLRTTKTGKYAWLIDFNDLGDNVLNRQFSKRYDRYVELTGISEDRIFYGITPDKLEKIFVSKEFCTDG